MITKEGYLNANHEYYKFDVSRKHSGFFTNVCEFVVNDKKHGIVDEM